MKNRTASAVIVPLGKNHNRAAFSCGNEELDRYLKKLAAQDERRNLARVFVLVGDDQDTIAGFYSLTSTKIDLGDLPAKRAKKLPHGRIIPGALIGRLAVGVDFQKQRWGEYILIDALKRIVEADKRSAVYAVIVDAINERAVSFYERYHFQKFPSLAGKLFLPIETARQLFSRSRFRGRR